MIEFEKLATPTINIDNDSSILRTAEEEESFDENSIEIDEESTESDDGSDYSTSTTIQNANALQHLLQQQEPATIFETLFGPVHQYQLPTPVDRNNLDLDRKLGDDEDRNIPLGTDKEWEEMMEGTSEKARNPLHQKPLEKIISYPTEYYIRNGTFTD